MSTSGMGAALADKSNLTPRRLQTIELLERTGQIERQVDLSYRLSNSLWISPTAVGFFDTLDASGTTWTATGWAFDFEAVQPCVDVLAVQGGKVITEASFTSSVRPDVNAVINLPGNAKSGVTVQVRGDSRLGSVSLVGVTQSGALLLLSGPGECIPADAGKTAGHTVSWEEWSGKFRKPLHRFPADTPFRDIYSLEPVYNPRDYPGITAQFLEEANSYHERYTDHRRWTYLLSQALFRARVDEKKKLSVFDVGSGSGNSVFPILQLLPRASIVATDISPQLLAILHRELSAEDRNRVLAVAMDASQPFINTGSFDLAIGAAILHHIIDPSTTIAACSEALGSNGHAIFFEPFELGYTLLRLLYEQLLDSAERLAIPEPVRNVLRAIVNDVAIRTGSDKTADVYRDLDDKWQFTHAYFEEQRARAGFSKVVIYPLDSPVKVFTNQFKTHLRLCGVGEQQVSPQVWQHVSNFEAHFSPGSAPERALEACVILSK